jgi:drug/metabolite transporter (DMT)-like permease
MVTGVGLDPTSVPSTFFIASGMICVTGINLVNRLAVNSIKTRWGVLASNYVVASMLGAAMYLLNDLQQASTFTLMLGLVTGLLYTGGMFLGITTIGRRGASIAVSVSQLSVLIPVSLSVAVFGESLASRQILGVAIALVSLPLLAAKVGGGLSGGLDRSVLLLLLAQLLVQGVAQFSSKILVALGFGAEKDVFFLAAYAAATLVTVPIAFKHRGEVGGADPLYGGLVGAFNIGGNLSTLLALSTLPGAVVFPLVSSGGLLLVMVLSRLIFRERLNRLNLLGVVLTLLAVVLINF